MLHKYGDIYFFVVKKKNHDLSLITVHNASVASEHQLVDGIDHPEVFISQPFSQDNVSFRVQDSLPASKIIICSKLNVFLSVSSPCSLSNLPN
jgi:hypothetical protein